MNKQVMEMTLDVLWQKGFIGDYANKRRDIKEAITIILSQAQKYPDFCGTCTRSGIIPSKYTEQAGEEKHHIPFSERIGYSSPCKECKYKKDSDYWVDIRKKNEAEINRLQLVEREARAYIKELQVECQRYREALQEIANTIPDFKNQTEIAKTALETEKEK